MKQNITFRSQARIVRTLGDRLISGEVAAIIELVKNAYDADATACFIEINPEKDSILIEDNGHGMSLKDIQFKWAEIGTDNKYRDTRSKSNKRHVLGNKGIGRLAASKLGRYLEITSTIKDGGNYKSIHVTGIDWDAFSEKSNQYIEDVKFFVEEFSLSNVMGTKLIISRLTQKWTEEKLKSLISELQKLMSPILKDDNEFNIYLNLDSFNKNTHNFDGEELVNGRRSLFSTSDKNRHKKNLIEPFPLLEACDYTFDAEYTKNGVTGVLKVNDAKVEHSISVAISEPVDIGNGLIHLNIFDRDADSVKNTFVKAGIISKDDRKSISLRDARSQLDNLSGIAIYRNKFRIRPYGDKDADWLNLDRRRIQNPSKCLEQKQISGLILVDDENKSGLIERSSREGFEHNDNYIFFKEFILKLINEIEVLRFAHNSRTGKNRNRLAGEMKSTFNSLKEKTGIKKIENFSENLSGKKKDEFKATVAEYKTSLDKLIDIIQERQALLEARSTLGFILAEVVHEAKHPTSAVGSDLISLSKRVKGKWAQDIRPTISEILLDQFGKDLSHIESLEDLLKRLDPLINIRRKKSIDFSIHEVVKRSQLVFKERAKKLGVHIFHDLPSKTLKMHGLEVDLSTAIINLIDNALYWHEKRNIVDPFIKISYIDKDDYISISIEDNAGGISEKYKDSIFNVGFTTKEEGSGLGLSIAREALGRAGSYISHSNISTDRSLFEIEIRRDI